MLTLWGMMQMGGLSPEEQALMGLNVKNIRLDARLKEEQLRTANFEVGTVQVQHPMFT